MNEVTNVKLMNDVMNQKVMMSEWSDKWNSII